MEGAFANGVYPEADRDSVSESDGGHEVALGLGSRPALHAGFTELDELNAQGLKEGCFGLFHPAEVI